MSLSVNEQLLAKLLAPLIRFFVRNGIYFQQIQELCRKLYVEVAVDELGASGSKVNVSRLSVLTGLTRKEVRRIYVEDRPAPHIGPSIFSRVLNRWEQSDEFTTTAGKPRVLSYQGEESEFYALVESVTTSINPGTVLHEFLRSGAAIESTRGLKLVRSTDIQSQDATFRIELAAEGLATLLQLAQENAVRDFDERHLHLRTFFDNISVEALPKLRKWMRKEGAGFHKKARDLFSRHDVDINPKAGSKAGGRVVLVAFGYTNEDTKTGGEPVK